MKNQQVKLKNRGLGHGFRDGMSYGPRMSYDWVLGHTSPESPHGEGRHSSRISFSFSSGQGLFLKIS